ncbi:MAG: OmpA family protein [Cyclobacteriaceae bacterium]|nr:OmpA family protein [Cyclobacteriaceae bacterium]
MSRVSICIYLIFLLITISVGEAYAQPRYSSTNKRAIKLYQEAEDKIKQRDFQSAITLLEKAVERDDSFYEAHLRAAFCHEFMRDLPAQLYHLEQVIKLRPGDSRIKNVYFSLAKAYFNSGQYDKSYDRLVEFQRFPVSDARIKIESDQLMENIVFARDQIKNPIDIQPRPLPDIINTFPLQYFPVLTADENTIFFTRRLGNAFHHDEDIYIAEKDESGQWQAPVPISPNINSQFNEGTCTISADGRTLIFTTCEGRKGYGSCDLYLSVKDGDEWSVPVNLGPQINSRYWESQPSLSADGRTLYFVSDRPGGQGKRDLWMSELNESDQWKPARNLGPEINTPEDEVSPYIHVNGFTLFFASKGHPGMGGFDLYSAERKNTGWSKPVNLGYPINTHDDQVSLFVSTDGKRGYYSYETASGARNNRSLLYMFEFPPEAQIARRSNYLKGNVYDADDRTPLKASVELIDLETDTLVSRFITDASTGGFFTILTEGKKYALFVESKGYLYESRSFDLESVAPEEPVIEDFYLRPVKTGSITKLSNVFFETNQYQLTSDSRTELDKVVRFLKENQTVNIEISGHTDDVGQDAFNRELSEKRALSVRNYLIENEIDKNRIRSKGYGKSRPLAPNTSEENRALNRRIEFEIIE